MSHIELEQLVRAAEHMEGQIQALHRICEETVQAEERIKGMIYMERVRRELEKSREAAGQNIRILQSMIKVLRETVARYQKVERMIVDRYHLDTVVYPEVEFGTSYITGLEEYRSLILF